MSSAAGVCVAPKPEGGQEGKDTHHDDRAAPENIPKRQRRLSPRHFEQFLGIGDVFLEPPTHALPMMYYGSELEATPNDICNFVSTEMVGRLKTVPEDFVVQEIMNLTSLLVGTNQQDGGAQQQTNDGAQIATFVDRPLQEPPPRAAGSATRESGDTDSSPPPTESHTSTPKEPIEIIDWSQAEQNPRQLLETILQMSQSKSLGLLQSTDELIQKLCGLQSTIIQSLDPSHKPPDLADGKRIVKILLQGDSQRQDRGRLHKWVRSAFPMLQTDVIADNPDDKNTVTIHASFDDRFLGLLPFLHDPVSDLPRLYSFFRQGQPNNNESPPSSSQGKCRDDRNGRPSRQIVLPLRVDLERSQRREIHQLLAEKSGRRFQTDTRTDHPVDEHGTTTAAIVVSWSMKRVNNRKRKRNQDGLTETSMPPTHTMLVLRKRNVEHTAAMHSLSKAFRCRTSDIQYAGIKDRQAITTQFISVNNRFVPMKRILSAQASLRSHGLDLCGPFSIQQGLKRGQARGNRFTIVLRNLQQIQVSYDNASGHAREDMIPCQRDNMDKAVERICRRGFINLFGEQRVGPVTVDKGTRAVDIGRAILRQDWEQSVDLILRIGTDANSVRVSKTWQDSNGDVVETWKALSKSQGGESRQRVLLQSLKRHGGDPMMALQSLSNYDRTFWVNAYQSFVWNMAATERIRMYPSDRVVVGDLVESSFDASTEGPILVASEEMACRFSIQNVVLPLPGYMTKYPSNKAGNVYERVLTMDKIKFVKDAPLDGTAKGSYRPLIVKPNNLEHTWLVDGGDATECRFRFDLPTGSYATMLFRELLRTTVVR